MATRDKRRAQSNARAWTTTLTIARPPYCPCCAHALQHHLWWVVNGMAVCMDCLGIADCKETIKLALQSIELEQMLLTITAGIYFYVPSTLAAQTKTLAQRVYDNLRLEGDRDYEAQPVLIA